VDKPDLSLAAIAAEEVAEECGYQVAPEQLKELASSVSSAGTAGTLHTVFYGRVSGAWPCLPRGCVMALLK
jgi:8-oxo-dGTP pyrophosphatase MutT (NUDIX family)